MRIKQLILIAAVAIAAASCAHSFEAEQTQQAAIGFGTWAETLTKAESRTQGSSAFLGGDTFKVWGHKTDGTGSTAIFPGVVVTAQGASDAAPTSWTYSPLRFWDPTATNYTFYAVSPSATAVDSPAGGGAYTGLIASNGSITFAGKTNDILVASQKVVSSPYSSEPVELKFNHIASLVDVKVKRDASLSNDAILRITGASLVAVENEGTFTVTGYDANNDYKPVISWGSSNTTTYSSIATPLNVTIKTTYNNDGTTTADGTTNSNSEVVTVPDDLESLFSGYVLKPQSLSAGSQKLQLAYKIVTQEASDNPVQPEISTSYTTEIALNAFVVTDNKSNTGEIASSNWAQGTHYTYTVTIGANAINFTASINDWTPVNGYNYLLQ